MTRDLTTRSRGRFLPQTLGIGLIVAATAVTTFIDAPLARGAAPASQADTGQDSAAPGEDSETTEAAAEQHAPRFDPAELRPTLEQASVALELAAYLTSQGDAESARAHLRGVDEASIDDAQRQRVAEELARVEAWIETRDRFLGQLLETGRKYMVPDGEKRRRVQFERIEDGTVYFAENRWKIASIPVTELNPLDLAREMGNKKLAFDAGWVRLYMYALCGDKRWKRLLKGDEEELIRLRAAGEGEYPAWLIRGQVYAAILELSEAPVPSDATSGSAMLARIHELVEQHGGRRELEAVRPQLAELAECAQYAALASGSLDELFAGQVTELDDGLVRIEYSFANEEVLRDFAAGRYPRSGNGFEPDADSSGMRIEEGVLIAEGNACLRTHASFEGAIEVRYTYATLSLQGGGGMICGVHDSGDGNMVRAMDVGMLWWSDQDQTPPFGSVHYEGMISFRQRVEYEISIVLDGKGKVEVARDGKTMLEMSDCPRKRGAVFLSVEDDRGGKFRISELVIEGRLTKQAREELRLRRASRAADRVRTP